MIKKKNYIYTFFYCAVLIISVFAPEVYGVSLKYAFIPLVGMLCFSSINLKSFTISTNFIVGLCLIAVVILSTICSDVVTWSAAARSVCIMIFITTLLEDCFISEKDYNIIKILYILICFFCAVWIIVKYSLGFNRMFFLFVLGPKDVNYLAASMLPGAYWAARFAFIEKRKGWYFYIVCVIAIFIGIIMCQSRASFVTFIVSMILFIIEFIRLKKVAYNKAIVVFLIVVFCIISVVFLWNDDNFVRITDFEKYKSNVRLIIWGEGIKSFLDNPIIGNGIGASNVYSNSTTGYDTHNNYIDILGDLGLIGGVLFLILFYNILKVKKGNRLRIVSLFITFMLPLAFINGLQTVSFWLPVLMLGNEKNSINRNSMVVDISK